MAALTPSSDAAAMLAEDIARQKEVFGKDLDEAVYAGLKSDDVRMSAYLRAIARAAPGKRVLDVGTGPEALLAVAAAKAGATSVVACEVNAATAALARKAVEAAGVADVVSVVAGHSAELDLGAVDLVVSEIVGDLASEEGMAATLAALPPSVVARTGAWSVPARAETWVAPASLRLPAGGDGSSDVRLPMVPPPACVLGERRLMESVDARDLRLEQTRVHSWTVGAPATLTGFFCAPKIVLDDEIAIDCWTERTSWRSVLCLLDDPVLVEAGDVVALRVDADLRRFPVVHTLTATLNGKPAGTIVVKLPDSGGGV